MGFRRPRAVNNDFYEALGRRWLHAQDDPVALLRAEGEAKGDWVEARLRDHFGPPGEMRPVRLLDVGCGAGFLARRLVSTGYDVHAIDFSRESLRVSQGEDPRVAYARADALRLPYRDRSFDAVTSLDFLEHVEDPAGAVREAARVLKPGGLFLFHTFNRNPLSWLVVIKGLEWFVRNTPERMHVLRLFLKPRELAGFCRAAGLEPFAWTGIRPLVARRAFWRLLRTGVVPADFAFTTTRSLLLSYMGAAEKR